MKVKLLKRRGFFQLAVADLRINNLYGFTNERPVILASLSNKEPSQCWRLKDIRLCETITPLDYLLEHSMQKHIPLDQADSDNLTSQLQRFNINENGEIIWSVFDGVVGGGDKTNDPFNPRYADYFAEGCWSFKVGLNKMNEMKEFWKNFNSEDISSAKIHNSYKQFTAFEYQLANNYFGGKISTNKKVKISI